MEIALEVGQKNLRVMQMLDEGHVEAFGKPSPAVVTCGSKAGPGILMTGHDLVDLHELLKRAEGTNVNVYTHGEMLPAHMYPKLREHPNLAGHWGGTWQKQKQEFPHFAGPIVATTNCILIPPKSTPIASTRRVHRRDRQQAAEERRFLAGGGEAQACPLCPNGSTALQSRLPPDGDARYRRYDGRGGESRADQPVLRHRRL